jgi:hypothetical protein
VVYLTAKAYVRLRIHFRGSLPGEGDDEAAIPLSQPSPIANPDEDKGVQTTTRFNILSYPLYTIDSAADDAYDSSDPSKSGSGSPPFNPRLWAKPAPPPDKPVHGSYSVAAPQAVPRRGIFPTYPSNPCTPPSPHYSYEPLPEEGHRPTTHVPDYADGGYQGNLHERAEPFIKQEYVEDNQLISGPPDPRYYYVPDHSQSVQPVYYW